MFLVVGRAEVEGGEELAELLRWRLLHDRSKVGHGVEQRLDLLCGRRAGPRGFELGEALVDGAAAGAQFVDALRGERDDRVGGVVVLLEAERLPVERAVELVAFACESDELA